MSIRAHVEIDGATHPDGELFSNLRCGRFASAFAYGRAYLGLKSAHASQPIGGEGQPIG